MCSDICGEVLGALGELKDCWNLLIQEKGKLEGHMSSCLSKLEAQEKARKYLRSKSIHVCNRMPGVG